MLSSFLAVWSSVASTAFLLALVAVEGFLAFIAAPSNTCGRVLLPVSLTSSAVIAVTIAERLQKEVYHRYSARLSAMTSTPTLDWIAGIWSGTSANSWTMSRGCRGGRCT